MEIVWEFVSHTTTHVLVMLIMCLFIYSLIFLILSLSLLYLFYKVQSNLSTTAI